MRDDGDGGRDSGGFAGEDRRSFFRVDDSFPVKVKRVDRNGEHSSRFLFHGTLPRVVGGGPEYQESLIPLLLDINRKLDTLLNALVFKEDALLNAVPRRLNISASGIGIELEEEFRPGDLVELRMLLPSSPPSALLIHGEVTRVEVQREGERMFYNTAIDFVGLTEEVKEEIIRYTLQRQREIVMKRREPKKE